MKLTWYGHAAFRLDVGKSTVLIDPFLTGNPKFEALGLSVAEVAEGVTHIALTHGHDDHVGDTVAIAKQSGATILTIVELGHYLEGQGVEKTDTGNMGGTLYHDGFAMTFVNALHSSSTVKDGIPIYLGNPTGLIFKAEGKNIYHMGDTDVFAGMEMINDLHKPDIGIVPIGDRYTMDPRRATYACKTFFEFSTIIPCHYGTFPVLEQSADKFVAAMSGHNVVAMDVGQDITL